MFGNNNHNSGHDSFGANDGMRGSGFGTSYAQQPLPPLTQAFRQAGDAIVSLQRETQHYQSAEHALMEQVRHLMRAIEAVNAHYAAVTAERDQYNNLLKVADGRMMEVQRVVQRYTIVQEPVVASDGYTYERRVIKQYLDECMRSGVSPVSQQTQMELTSTLIPNQSLKKLVELLRNTRPGADGAQPPATGAAASTPAAAASPQGASASAANKSEGSAPAAVTKQPAANNKEGRLHPCVRVYGYCNYKDTCTYAQYPYDACLSHLKGKCRFGAQCHELHVDFRGPTGSAAGPRAGRKD